MGICGSVMGKHVANPLQVDASHFNMERVVGKVGFGKVQACIKETECGGDKGTWYAVKIMSKAVAIKRKMTEEFFMERAMCQQVNHKFLCNGRYSWQDKNFCYIVLDLALGGDVSYHMRHPPAPLKNGKAQCLKEDLAKFYFAQLATALNYLHNNRIIHRDIKPENMVVAEGGYVMLTDFGISQKLAGDGLYKGSSGTPGYMAPEIYTRAKLQGPPSDWFSAGITLHKMLTGKMPFAQTKPVRKERVKGKKVSTKEGERKVDWEGVTFPDFEIQEGGDGPLSREVAELLTGLLQLDPSKRPDLQGVEQSAWFTGFDWAGLNAKTMVPPFTPNVYKPNCEMDDNELEKGLMGGGETMTPEQEFGAVTEEQQKLFQGYEWNVNVADLELGKRQEGSGRFFNTMAQPRAAAAGSAPGVEEKA